MYGVIVTRVQYLMLYPRGLARRSLQECCTCCFVVEIFDSSLPVRGVS